MLGFFSDVDGHDCDPVDGQEDAEGHPDDLAKSAVQAEAAILELLPRGEEEVGVAPAASAAPGRDLVPPPRLLLPVGAGLRLLPGPGPEDAQDDPVLHQGGEGEQGAGEGEPLCRKFKILKC